MLVVLEQMVMLLPLDQMELILILQMVLALAILILYLHILTQCHHIPILFLHILIQLLLQQRVEQAMLQLLPLAMLLHQLQVMPRQVMLLIPVICLLTLLYICINVLLNKIDIKGKEVDSYC